MAGEPQIVATIPPATARPTEAPHPLTPPDIAQGAAVFAMNCTRCHGVNGDGTGELVAAGEVPQMASFRERDTAADQRPVEWWQTITNGRIENLMPPWEDALTAEERWAVGMYAYTLHYDRAQIERGQALYAEHCQECHGDGGAGDGPRADELSGSVGDLTSQQNMALLSDQVMFTSIHGGIGDPEDGMPAFGDILTAEEIWDTVSYTRTLSLDNLDAIGAAPQPTTAPAIAQAPTLDAAATPEVSADLPAAVTISGTVTNATATGTVPPDLALRLFVFDETFQQTEYDTTINAEGMFAFADVPFDLANTYVVTTDYRERVFTSDIVQGAQIVVDAADGVVELPVTIYELTEDPAVITITGIATQVNVIGDGMEIAQVFSVRNTSDRAFSSSQTTSDGRPISLVIALPPGALVAGFGDNQQRFVVSDENNLVFDTIPVLPGTDHIVQVVYLLQYGGGAIVEQELTYTLDGEVRLLVNPPTLAIDSEQFQPIGEQVVGGRTYQAYGGTLSLPAGDVLRYEISGAGIEAGQVGDRTERVVSSGNLLIIIGIVLITAAFAGGVVVIIAARNRQRIGTDSAANQAEIDSLAAQIAELDSMLDAGEITPETHERRRAALRARLAALMQVRIE